MMNRQYHSMMAMIKMYLLRNQDYIALYKMKQCPENAVKLYNSYNTLIEFGLKPDMKDYELMLTEKVDVSEIQDECLEDCYQAINESSRLDSSLPKASVSDIMLLHHGNSYIRYYIDTKGFKYLS